MANSNLAQAKRAQNDEFYTQYPDIEREVNAYLEYDPDTFRGKTILLPCDDPEWSHFTKFFAQRFEVLGLKKLISTSYAYMSNENRQGVPYQPTLFEQGSTLYQEERSPKCGKIYTLTHDHNGDGVLDIDDLEWQYLEGDGDFRSREVTALRDEADIIITNPPFSLFREFLAWIVEADKKFLIIGNMNAITYKEVFPLIKENKLWLGNGFQNGNAYFRVFDNTKEYAEGVYNDTKDLVKFRNCVWYTNLDHGRRHRTLELMTMEDNLKYNKKLIKKGGYQKYDNYDAIEVPYTDAIPKDYSGVMGVPISFLDKYNPDQFEILNANDFRISDEVPIKAHGLIKDKEATITTVENADLAERERERENKNNLRTHLHQTHYSPQELTDGTSMARGSLPASLSASYYDMVVRPKIAGKEVYRRIFIIQKSL